MNAAKAALAATFLLAGCGSAHEVATAAPSAPPSAASAPSRDPACGNAELRIFLGQVQEEYDRGAFDLERDVGITAKHTGEWVIALSGAKSEAGLQLYKSLEPLDEAIGENFISSSDPLVRQARALTIKISASTVLLECGLSGEYTFDD